MSIFDDAATEGNRLYALAEALSAEIATQKEYIAELEARLAATKVKPVPRGIFTRQSVAKVGTSTIQLHWNTVEAIRDVYDFTGLEAQLDAAPAEVRIRPYLGQSAPAWAKTLGNGPINYLEPQGGDIVQLPDIWDLEYQRSAAAFMQALADYVDDDDRVGLVFATGAMTYYAEPFIRGTQNWDNRQAFLDAGYTAGKDTDAQFWQVEIMAPFKRTNVGLAYNPWQYIGADGKAGSSVTFMADVMDFHAGLFGTRTVLQNNSIRASYIADPPPMYQEFIDRPDVAHQFQCAAASRVGDEAATIRWAIDYLGATGIEHSGTLAAAEYAAFDAEMKGA